MKTLRVVKSENRGTVCHERPVKLWKLDTVAFDTSGKRYWVRRTFNFLLKQNSNKLKAFHEIEWPRALFRFVIRFLFQWKRRTGRTTATVRVKSRVVRVARKVGNLRSLAISKNAFRLEDIGWKYASLPRELQQSQYCRGHRRQCWADFLRIGNTNDWNLRLVVSILGLLFEKVRDAALLEIIVEFRNNREAWNLNCFIDNCVS